VELSGALKVVAVSLTKIAGDLALMGSGPRAGIGEIFLPELQKGSSIMPGKVNPVLAEMLNMAMYHVIGLDAAVALASQAGQLELNVMMPIIAHDLFEMMQITIGAVNAFTQKCVVGIQANVEKAAAWLMKNPIVVTALNPLIGYAKGAELVKEALQRGLSIEDVAIEKARLGMLVARDDGRPVSESQIRAVFSDLEKLTRGGLVSGAGGGG